MRQAVAWWCLARCGLTLPQLAEAALAIGYAGIEMAEPQDWIGQEFVPRGEPIAALRDAFARCQRPG